MSVKIDPPTWTSTQITFRLRNVRAADTYWFTVNDEAGRPLGGSTATPVQPPAGVKGAADRIIDIMSIMAPEPSGSYELRVFENDEIDPATQVPLAEAEPEVEPFQYVPAPPAPPGPPPPPQVVRLDRGAAIPTADEVLSTLVLAATSARSFAAYKSYVDRIVCRPAKGSALGGDTYRRLHRATLEFLEQVRGPVVDPGGVLAAYLTADGLLPYVDSIAQRYPDALTGDPCSDLDPNLLAEPFPVELSWCYWEEEAGLVQALNHVLARFQNRRVGPGLDPLARFDLNPLRPLRHLLWSWVEDEVARLTVRRRAAEYQFEYGLPLVGRAVPRSGVFVESRSRFLESFHTLLYEAQLFFERDDDTTVNADAFPVYNALRDTHLVLAEGASNQFGDLPTQARVEMLEMQWLFSQPEIREFLGGKPMVPYDEPWMPHLDTMKSLYGWASASVTHFHELAVRGEQLLLTIRWGNWNSTAVTADSAKNWARTWRNQIQRYVHAYRAVTGVDLTAGPDATPPAYLLSRRAPSAARRA
jgi:hypothetical protein